MYKGSLRDRRHVAASKADALIHLGQRGVGAGSDSNARRILITGLEGAREWVVDGKGASTADPGRDTLSVGEALCKSDASVLVGADTKVPEAVIDFRRRRVDISCCKSSILSRKASTSLSAYPSSRAFESETTESRIVSKVDLDITMHEVSPLA